jgi:hypothetical protein
VVEVHDVLLDFWTEQLTCQRATGENNDSLECVMRLREAQTLPAYETSCTKNHYRAGVRHTVMTRGFVRGYEEIERKSERAIERESDWAIRERATTEKR